MESYHKRKKLLEEKCGKFINLKPYNDDVGTADNKQQNMLNNFKIYLMKRIETSIWNNICLYQHYNKLFIAGTKGFPVDHIDDSKLQFDDTLNKTTRGKTADAHYRSHHEIDTVIGHSLGGAVALSLEEI